jgi:hypothetical protein
MRKITPGIILLLVFIIGGSAFYIYPKLKDRISFGPCFGFGEVGEFDTKINSEIEAKQVAVSYYTSIGYNFTIKNMTAFETDKGWEIVLSDPGKLTRKNLCLREVNPPECIGQRLILQERLFGKNKILMEYFLPC